MYPLPRGYTGDVEPTDLTVRILQDIREDIHGVRQELRDEIRGVREEIRGLREEMNARFEAQNKRFEVIETAIRDVLDSLAMLARGVKAAIEVREVFGARIEDHERRIGELEKRTSS